MLKAFQPIDPQRLTFYVQVYKDPQRCDWCLNNFRKHYPHSRLYIVSDGCDHPRWPKIAEKFNAEYYACERLKLIENGGRMLHRNFMFFLDAPTDFLFKFDTDTGFHRRFRWLPEGADYFGTVQGGGGRGWDSIQGGCAGFSRYAIEVMVKNEYFLKSELCDVNTWGDHPVSAQRVKQTRCICEDWVTGYVANQCGFECVNFGEVMSKWRQYVPNPLRRYAVTHPCKDLRL